MEINDLINSGDRSLLVGYGDSKVTRFDKINPPVALTQKMVPWTQEWVDNYLKKNDWAEFNPGECQESFVQADLNSLELQEFKKALFPNTYNTADEIYVSNVFCHAFAFTKGSHNLIFVKKSSMHNKLSLAGKLTLLGKSFKEVAEDAYTFTGDFDFCVQDDVAYIKKVSNFESITDLLRIYQDNGPENGRMLSETVPFILEKNWAVTLKIILFLQKNSLGL